MIQLTKARWPFKLEQVRVAASADKVQIVPCNFVDQQPVRLYVTLPVLRPIASKRVIFVAWRQGSAAFQEQDQFAELAGVLAALPREFHIAAKLFPGMRLRKD